jgi:hypothetical protein
MCVLREECVLYTTYMLCACCVWAVCVLCVGCVCAVRVLCNYPEKYETGARSLEVLCSIQRMILCRDSAPIAGKLYNLCGSIDSRTPGSPAK